MTARGRINEDLFNTSFTVSALNNDDHGSNLVDIDLYTSGASRHMPGLLTLKVNYVQEIYEHLATKVKQHPYHFPMQELYRKDDESRDDELAPASTIEGKHQPFSEAIVGISYVILTRDREGRTNKFMFA